MRQAAKKRIKYGVLTLLLAVGLSFSCTYTTAKYYKNYTIPVPVDAAIWSCDISSEIFTEASFFIGGLSPGNSVVKEIILDATLGEFPTLYTMSFSTFGNLPIDLYLYVDSAVTGNTAAVFDRPEPYTDDNGNGQYDFGEEFEDYNGDGVWTQGDRLLASGAYDISIVPAIEPVRVNVGGPNYIAPPGVATHFYLVIDWQTLPPYKDEIFSGDVDYINVTVTTVQEKPA